MKKIFIYLVLISTVIIAQTSVVPQLFPVANAPSIILSLVVAWTMVSGFMIFLPWLVLLGVLTDLAAFQPVGTTTIVSTLVAYFVSFFSKRFSGDTQGSVPLLLIFFMIVAHVTEKLYGAVLIAFSNGKDQAFASLGHIHVLATIGAIAFEIICAIFLQKVLKWTKRYFEL